MLIFLFQFITIIKNIFVSYGRTNCSNLSSAPQTFTTILKPVAAHLREKGIHCVFYLNDILILGRSLEEWTENIQFTTRFLKTLGFIINQEKSQLHPAQCLIYLGFCINSRTMTLSLPAEKVNRIVGHCQEVLQAHALTVQELAQLIGRLSSSIQAVFPAHLYYRNLQQDKIAALHVNNSYESQVVLSQSSRE